MHKDKPLVSVIITTYNRSLLLIRAINSVINQTYTNLEIIIVNDGSSDNTDEVIRNYLLTHKNIRYIKNSISKGANAARNLGILNSRGYFVAGLDDDDEFLPCRIELLVRHYDDRYAFITSRSLQIFQLSQGKTAYAPIINLNLILFFNAVGNQILIKRDTIIECGLFDENLLRYQDYDMWLRILAYTNKTAKMISNVTQIIDYSHEVQSNNIKKKNFKGAYFFYRKHRSLMNKDQRWFQIYIIKKIQEKAPAPFLTRAYFFIKVKSAIFFSYFIK